MHGQYALLGEYVVEHREDTLLHFARILRPADEYHPAREIHDDKRLAVEPVFLRVGGEPAGIDDRPLRHMRLELLGSGAAEKLFHEKIVPRKFGHDTDRHRIA